MRKTGTSAPGTSLLLCSGPFLGAAIKGLVWRCNIGKKRQSRLLFGLCTSALLSFSGPIRAADSEGGFLVRGMGGLRCEALLNGLSGSEQDLVYVRLLAWLSGYLSHVNRIHPSAYDTLPFQEVEQFAVILVQLCTANREAPVEAVTHRALAVLAPLVIEDPEPAVALSQGSRTVLMRPSVLTATQALLADRGLLPLGTADGIYGEQTAQALRRFQETMGVEVTGLPDAWTVFMLKGSK